ncbi:MAG: carbonic anhydrase [Myxococcota bacterium]
MREDVHNTGQILQWMAQSGSTLTFEETAYQLTRIDLHGRSEHTLDGAPFELEFQLVHESTAGDIVIVAVFATGGAANEAFDVMGWGALPVTFGDFYSSFGDFYSDAAAFELRALLLHGLVSEQRHGRYEGSMTTPPCTEGVRWVFSTDGCVGPLPQADSRLQYGGC